jgi:hypothetical protein
MDRAKDFDSILNECIEAIVNEGATVESCLRFHPQYAGELKPLLETVYLASGAASVKPRNDFRIKARYEFQEALREREPRPERRGFMWWRPQWVVTLVSVLVLLAGGSGTVAAASGSMPDEPLYPVKLATETVRLALTPSEIGKAEVYASIIDERIEEIARMAEEGKEKELEETTGRLTEQLVVMNGLVGMGGDAAAALEAPVTPRITAPPPAPEPAPREEEQPMMSLAPSAEKPEKAMDEPEAEASPAPPRQPATAAEGAPIERYELQETPPPGGSPAEERLPHESAAVDKETEREANLEALLAQQSAANRERLEEALRNAPESVRERLLRVLETTEAGYEQVLRALERSRNSSRR